MLNRRHLRVKVVQTLYAYSLSEDKDIKTFEKALLKNVDEVYEMYMWTLNLLDEVSDYVLIDAEGRANKFLPTEKDLSLTTKLSTNTFIESLRQNPQYGEGVKKYKISWSFDPEIVRTVFLQLKDSEAYLEYLQQEDRSIGTEKDIIKHIFKKIILKSPVIEQVFEEKFINWPVDKEVLQALIAKTFKNFSSEDPRKNKLAEITQNWNDDSDYVIALLGKTIRNTNEYQKLISEKTKNWESDRIALMDTLLMRMAICELVNFPSIPVKVTINEYIEISKVFSTLKSNTFINGILDKILNDLNQQGRIQKAGRGLRD
ncbi:MULTISPECIES: transcription antitermination factor NusB [Sphingobacterium]|jgi:N utilization substance protein B|uniref:NusB antitermination factor n=3 Tax=Sphingobacterium TaxID=28453 RepID=A0A420GAY3_9SPHI|nr:MULTISPECIES: transcription antitermination factor NusB [Sphingobacterium]MDF2851137.1 transcription antitermination factor NusB [Sphingobacterium multivorum]MDR3008743.1 transcription antitermination factor NusB [Sphingobacterium sp.]OFV15320.1 transcription antitermination factor NusB [Sphingobacterium sp. HMSC13C05]OJZ13925.1 MAG: transcription antitermination factor NusB [Sphingobacterium sp. 40-24]QQT46472.1 transcription antitermination factor NusB [Sphingobacterium multivorum]